MHRREWKEKDDVVKFIQAYYATRNILPNTTDQKIQELILNIFDKIHSIFIKMDELWNDWKSYKMRDIDGYYFWQIFQKYDPVVRKK